LNPEASYVYYCDNETIDGQCIAHLLSDYIVSELQNLFHYF